MNIKQIEKATALVAKIKRLDEDIILLEKMAIEMSNGQGARIKIEVEFSTETKKPNVFDEHGFIKDEYKGERDFAETPVSSCSNMFSFVIDSCGLSKPKKDEVKKFEFSEALSDSDSLMILNVLVFRKNQQRKKIINQLEKMSFA